MEATEKKQVVLTIEKQQIGSSVGGIHSKP